MYKLISTCAICFLLAFSLFADDYKKEILGSWYSLDDPSAKIEFMENGKVNFYKDDEIYSTDKYFIVADCTGDTISVKDGKYLKTIDSAGEIECIQIQGINLFGKSELWLMDKEAGQSMKYSRDKSK